MARTFAQVTIPDEPFDAIVVGSGISGGFAAKELTEKGLRTLMLERGRNVRHVEDYVTEGVPPWAFSFRNGKLSPAYSAEEYFIQSRTGQFNESAFPFFINDRENPYVEEKPFTWIRGNHVGGRSLMWGRQCYRWSDLDFEANAREGIGVDWPIRYADIAPWYDYVEAFVGISGEALGLAHLPDGPFLPPMPLNAAERQVQAGIARHFDDRLMTVGRVANLTQGLNERSACQYRNQCWRGCSYRAYFSSVSVTLPMAEATGNLTLRPHSLVHSILYDEALDRATGVRVIDTETREVIEYRGKLIFLCASTLGSTQILLNSKTPRFSEGLANSSGVLGHYLMDHHYQVGAEGIIEGLEDRYLNGRRPNGIYIPRFQNLDERTRRREYVRGFGYQGSAQRPGWVRGGAVPGFGAELKAALRDPGPWTMRVNGFGEALPDYDNYVTLDEERTDSYGLPQLRIHCEWKENELAMRKEMAEAAAEMLEAGGATRVETYDHYLARGYGEPGLGIHEMGTARMGRDPQTSVLNAYNQAHDVPNLFVTDGACMSSSACQNPSITYMALTARAVDYAVGELNRRNV